MNQPGLSCARGRHRAKLLCQPTLRWQCIFGHGNYTASRPLLAAHFRLRELRCHPTRRWQCIFGHAKCVASRPFVGSASSATEVALPADPSLAVNFRPVKLHCQPSLRWQRILAHGNCTANRQFVGSAFAATETALPFVGSASLATEIALSADPSLVVRLRVRKWNGLEKGKTTPRFLSISTGGPTFRAFPTLFATHWALLALVASAEGPKATKWPARSGSGPSSGRHGGAQDLLAASAEGPKAS